MVVALRYTLLTLFTLFTLEWADGFLSKMLGDGWSGVDGYIQLRLL